MKEVIGYIGVLLVLIQPLVLLVGMVKPQLILPTKKIKKKRWGVFAFTSCLFVTGLFFVACFLPSEPKETSGQQEKNTPLQAGESELPDTLEIDSNSNEENGILTIELSLDSILVLAYRETFDSLYNELMQIDQLDEPQYYSRKTIHQKIQEFLYEDWWHLMEYIDSTREMLPLLRNEYKKVSQKYDKQYARFMLYGEEDTGRIEFWAEREADKILSQIAVDPKSLVIERATCNGKTNKGWQCTVVYRAKNGFGGYVRDFVVLIMAYDEGGDVYKCVDIR